MAIDAERVSGYMRELIEDRNLEQMSLLLRYLKWYLPRPISFGTLIFSFVLRQIEEKQNQKWSEAFKNISASIQSEMLLIYGKKLRL